MNSRYIPAAPMGFLMTAALLWLMQYLIETGHGAYTEPRQRFELKWIFVAPREVINEAEPPVVRPDPPRQPPPSQRPGESSDRPTIPIPTADRPQPPDFSQPDFGRSSGPLVDVMYVRPVYPNEAAARGLEGFVTVMFDVTAAGTVTHVRILESSHRVFERAARDAASRSRFRPRVVDGTAVPTHDIVRRYRFELEK